MEYQGRAIVLNKMDKIRAALRLDKCNPIAVTLALAAKYERLDALDSKLSSLVAKQRKAREDIRLLESRFRLAELELFKAWHNIRMVDAELEEELKRIKMLC